MFRPQWPVAQRPEPAPYKGQTRVQLPPGRTGIQVLAAAYLALNQGGEGSSPSGPTCTRDVTAAYLLAMQDVRVRFPLGAIDQDVGKPGNPPVSGTGKRGFKSHRPDWAVVREWWLVGQRTAKRACALCRVGKRWAAHRFETLVYSGVV